MIGLIFFAIVATWLVLSIWLASWLVGRLSIQRFRSTSLVMLSIVFFLLPVADELVARPQFNRLCEEGAALKIDASQIRGRTVRETLDKSNEPLSGVIVPILHSRFVYRDVATNAELGSYDVYRVRGGLLSRWTGWPEDGRPWTFDRTVCYPKESGKDAPTAYGFQLAD